MNIRAKLLSRLRLVPLGQMGIASMLSGLVSLTLSLTILTVGAYSLRTMFKSKYQDAIGLLFADAERLGFEIKNELSLVAPDLESQKRPDGILRLNSDGTLSTLVGPWSNQLSLRALKLHPDFFRGTLPKHYVLSIAGTNYLAESKLIGNAIGTDVFSAVPATELSVGSYLVLWKIPDYILRVDPKVIEERGTRVYVVSREGQLLYSNAKEISQSSFTTRPLVQSFFASPISQGYLATDDGTGSQIYGAYYELPDSNLVIFAETFQQDALASIYETIYNSGTIFFLILVIALVLLQFPLRRIIDPIRDLAQMAEEVAKGNFTGRIQERGQGELHFLTHAFNQMCQSLLDRDKSIQELRVQEVEKIALEGEMAIARNIQSNFLPPLAKQKLGNLAINSTYIPASQCAGDWYNVHHEDGHTLFVIADVSGHGVGSSMYTAMIAGIFDLFVRRPHDQWVLQDFVNEVNSVIFSLGKRQWHVTMIIGIHREGQLELLNAGHTHPILKYPKDYEVKAKRLALAANPLGLEPETSVKSIKVPFPAGSSLVLYTDGLTETNDPEGHQWGARKLNKVVSAHEGRQEVLDVILKAWKDHRHDTILQDDICVLTLKSA